MTEPSTAQTMAGPGDSLSQLIQLHCRKAGVSEKWTGKGREDLDLLVIDCSNKTLLSKKLWNGIKKLMEMKETNELPESVKAQICSIVLEARTHFELALDARNERARKLPPFPGQPGPGAIA